MPGTSTAYAYPAAPAITLKRGEGRALVPEHHHDGAPDPSARPFLSGGGNRRQALPGAVRDAVLVPKETVDVIFDADNPGESDVPLPPALSASAPWAWWTALRASAQDSPHSLPFEAEKGGSSAYSTVTLFARLRGWRRRCPWRRMVMAELHRARRGRGPRDRPPGAFDDMGGLAPRRRCRPCRSNEVAATARAAGFLQIGRGLQEEELIHGATPITSMSSSIKAMGPCFISPAASPSAGI